MNNNKQSSVEWLIGEIMRHQMTFYGTSSMPLWIIEQAKAMHKEECIHLLNTHNDIFDTSEDHYNETFNTKEK